jgi:uncharacterized protein YyaL (SSP411 family)
MTNRLAGETSPYLLQHADNPVDWYPWGPEAQERARREGKPLLLSVGYSACHWCHVMAHESFEDPTVAAVMNELFVNVKVDREERPDLDQIYQAAHALLSRRSGGWPLTMFLTPDGEPFYGGTYFPKHGRYGLPGFIDLLPRIATAYREQGDAIAEQSARLIEALASIEPQSGPDAGAGAETLPGTAPAQALAGLLRSFDPEHGGFGTAPKFPHPAELEFSLREHALRHDRDALHVVAHTLSRMADGGIHDQLGGGFCRYSVDAEWSIPHFEKMLYDNGPLLGLYADLSRITGDRRWATVARGIVGWLTREMRAPDGAFYSSLDADSDGEEGKFYVWSADDVRAFLPAKEYAVVAPHFGLDAPPNFEGHAWNLRVVVPVPEVAARLAIGAAEAQARLDAARQTLLAARARRVRPGTDDKILTSWNALAIAGLARAARALEEPAFADLALGAVDALRATVWRDGRLLATRKGDRAHLNAYLDDYAFLLAALIELMQTRFRPQDYAWAQELVAVLVESFEDRAHGGFFFTSHDHEALIHRPKPGHDNATPSGNGVAAQALIALGHLCADPGLVDAARRTVQLFAASIAKAPGGYATLLCGIEDLLAPPASVLLAGDPAECEAWQRALEADYRPTTRVFNLAGHAELPGALVRGSAAADGATAWVCRGTQCLAPIHALPDLLRALSPDG